MSGRFTTIWQRAARHPRLMALGLGAISATGFEPLSLWPVGFAALIGFIALLAQTATRKQAAILGWCFGFAHFTIGLNWIATAFTYQANMPAILGWAAVPLLSVYLAVYPTLACWAARWLAGERGGWALVLAFAGCWTVTEWLRAWVFTGFAWNPLASWLLGGFERPGIALLLPWLGTYALSAFAALIAGTLYWLLARQRWVWAGFGSAALVAAMFIPGGATGDSALRYTVVQPDIRQPTLNRPEFYERNFLRLANLSYPQSESEDESEGARRLVLWPESGLVDILADGHPQRYYRSFNYGGSAQASRQRLAAIIGEDSMLLTGGIDFEIENDRTVGAYNAVQAVNDEGELVAQYYKAHLVPYGEYLALRWLLEPLGATRLVPGAFDFLPGPGPQTLDLGEFGQVGIQVCYEIVFSGQVVEDGNRPDFLFNDSNDGWFGTWGPPQHLAQARLRAIEEGLPVLRSTTTGISGVIDAKGRVTDHIPSLEAARLDGTVPAALPPTLFAGLGNALPLGWAVLLLVAALLVRRRGLG